MRRLLRIITGTVLMLVPGAFLALEFVFLEETPALPEPAPPSAEDVATTRSLVRNIREATGPGRNTELETTAAQLNSAIRLGSRFVDGFRGQVSVNGRKLQGTASLPVPWWRGQRWLNVTGRVPEFDDRFALSAVTAGPVSLPPAPVLALARLGANLVIGDRFGDKVLQAATSMTIHEETLRFRIALDDVGKNGVMQGVFGTLRGAQMPSPALIEDYHQRLRAAMADGTLQQTGSFLPYIRFALTEALSDSTAETLPNAYTAAVFGLAKACGAQDFSMIVGRLAFVQADHQSHTTRCDAVTFNGRIDTRLHFITSAALQAASNAGVSVSVGEFKELYDTISGAGGFDFTDMAANLSGIALSDFLMTAPPEDWPAILAAIRTESDVIVPFDGIPPLMPVAEFKARFGDVESTRYKEMIDFIGNRIRGIGLYQAL